MKTGNEIRAKIDEYFEKLYKAKDEAERENIYHVIDALLWVIGDNSGAPI